jgi:hypothetical protein
MRSGDSSSRTRGRPIQLASVVITFGVYLALRTIQLFPSSSAGILSICETPSPPSLLAQPRTVGGCWHRKPLRERCRKIRVQDLRKDVLEKYGVK